MAVLGEYNGARMALTSGTKLGPYEIQSSIGAGGMGEVYRARNTRLACEVAIKVLPEAFARDTARLQRFEHQARVLSTVNHPNILAIHDSVKFYPIDGGHPRSVTAKIPDLTLAWSGQSGRYVIGAERPAVPLKLYRYRPDRS